MNKSKHYTILVVDDDPADRLLVSKILNGKYIIIEASNGREALILAQSEKPDIILMDIMMPELDGYSTLSIIKRNPITAEIPVIMLTDLANELNARLAKEWGASDYLTKTVNRQELLDRINQLLSTPSV
jgi:CheY-like chemotaxis protein